MMIVMIMMTCSRRFTISHTKSGTGRYSKLFNHLDILVSLIYTLFFVFYTFIFFQVRMAEIRLGRCRLSLIVGARVCL